MSHSRALSPIIIFVYNRYDHFEKMISFLQKAEGATDSDLIIYSDGPKNGKQVKAVQQVRNFAEGLSGFKSIKIHKSAENKGLKRSVIEGVSATLQSHNSVIVLEDDICTGPAFLQYMNSCLELYKNREHIWSVSGYTIPSLGEHISRNQTEKVFLAPRASSWGWGTWKDKWELAEWDNKKIRKKFLHGGNFLKYYSTGGDKNRMLLNELSGNSNSWAILWDFNHYVHNAHCIYPAVSQVKNIGLDNSGVHSGSHKAYEVTELASKAPELPQELHSNPDIISAFAKLNRKLYRDIWDMMRYLKMKIFY